MKKNIGFAVLAIILILIGLFVGLFSFSHFQSASSNHQRMIAAELSATKYKNEGDLTNAAKDLNWATFYAREVKDSRRTGALAGVGALILVSGGIIIFVKRK